MNRIKSAVAEVYGNAKALLLVVLVSFLMVMAGSYRSDVSAMHVEPIFTVDNPTCSDLIDDSIELKVEPVADGVYSDGTLQVTVDVIDTADGPTFDWSSNIFVAGVFVKGGNDGNLYDYGIPGETSDDGLHAPVNSRNNKFFGLSHISFCWVPFPATELTKTADILEAVVGETITYTIRESNTGNVPIYNVVVEDSLLGVLGTPESGDVGSDGILGVGETWEWVLEYTVQSTDCNDIHNEVTATGTWTDPRDRQEKDAPDEFAEADVEVFCPHTVLTKTADMTEAIVGETIEYTVTEENDGDVAINGVVVDDTLLGTLGAPDSGDDVNPGVLDVGETWTWTLRYTVESADCDDIHNEVTADGTFTLRGEEVPHEQEFAEEDVEVFCPHTILTKTPDITEAVVGETITYTIRETNDGDVAINGVVVEDTLLGTLGAPDSGDAVNPGILDIDETWEWALRYTVESTDCNDIHNEVTADGTFTLRGQEVAHEQEFAEADVEVFCPHTILTKAADLTEAVVGETITYTIRETNDGDVAINGVVVEDTLLGTLGAPDSGDDVNPGVLDVGETWTWTLRYTVESADCDDIHNEVTADGTFTLRGEEVPHEQEFAEEDVEVFCPHTILTKVADKSAVLAGDKITYTIRETNDGDVAINGVVVVDTLLGPLGPPDSGDAVNPGILDIGETWVWVVEYTTTEQECGTLHNEVTADGTFTLRGQEVPHEQEFAEEDVEVECPGDQCTLTIGFWKTHAGFNGNNEDLVSDLLPIDLGTPAGAKTLHVTTAQKAVDVLKFKGSNGVAAASNGINKLYAQLLGAKLTIASGLDDGSAVQATINAADAFLATHNSGDWSSLTKAQKNQVLAWASTLDQYNNGIIGPGHCDAVRG